MTMPAKLTALLGLESWASPVWASASFWWTVPLRSVNCLREKALASLGLPVVRHATIAGSKLSRRTYSNGASALLPLSRALTRGDFRGDVVLE